MAKRAWIRSNGRSYRNKSVFLIREARIVKAWSVDEYLHSPIAEINKQIGEIRRLAELYE